MGVCTVTGCSKSYQANGMCSAHRSASLRLQNPDAFKKYEQKRHQKHRDKRLASMKARDAKSLKQTANYRKKRYHLDPIYRLEINVRNRVRQGLKAKGLFSKPCPIRDLVGCSWQELRSHLEKQFVVGMSWSNRSEWHIDHILPLCFFDLSDSVQLKAACSYENLRPLWKAENLKKGGRLCSDSPT